MKQPPTTYDIQADQDSVAIIEWLKTANIEHLNLASQVIDSFPHGSDDVFGYSWMSYALESGRLASVQWMIEQGVDLNGTFSTEDTAHPPLMACLELRSDDKYLILELLINSGMDINQIGINGWTALHFAAMKNDQTAMSLLMQAGARRDIRTYCDDYATPEEEARHFGHTKSADFIANFVCSVK